MERKWWRNAVVYQVYWRSFNDSNGDGYGDLKGIIEKLDYIKTLGVDVLWVNPFFTSPDRDNGYDISDYYTIMEKAGDMETFERLLEEVHARGMTLIMDLVVNHTSDEHPWFLASKSSKDDPKRDWYIWKDGKGDEEPPSNWRSYFEPSTWTYDETTDQYYFHSFAKEQPDLNWENEEVRKEIYRMMRFWLDKGVDGFRMDVINLIKKKEGFPDADNPEDISYLGNNPGVHEFLQEMNREVLTHYDAFTVGEIPFVTPEDGLMYVGEDRNELDTLFHFEVCDDMETMDVRRFKEIQKRWASTFHGKGVNSQFLNNHDHTRMVTRFGNDGVYRKESAKALATLVHTLPGIPYIFQGEEIGMTGVTFDTIEEYEDIAMKNAYDERVEKGEDPDAVLSDLRLLSRDNSRTPMQWSSSPNAGFTDGTPWMKVNPNYEAINVENDQKEENSIFRFYQQLIELRKDNDAIVYGDYEPLAESHPSIIAYVRSFEGERILVVCNLSETKQETTQNVFEYLTKADLLLSNCSDNKLTLLEPYESRVLRIR